MGGEAHRNGFVAHLSSKTLIAVLDCALENGVILLPIIFVIALVASVIIVALVFMYRLYEEQVAEPRKLEDELKKALMGDKADVQLLEPVREAAAAISFSGNKIVTITHFDKSRTYPLSLLYGMEIFADHKLYARVVRAGHHKPLDTGSYRPIDDTSPAISSVKLRLIFDNPSAPDFEVDVWVPSDNLTARAEGIKAAFENCRDWFYCVEAYLRQPMEERTLAPSPEDPAPKASIKTDTRVDVLDAPLVPYTS